MQGSQQRFATGLPGCQTLCCRKAAYFFFYGIQLADTFQSFLCCRRLRAYIDVVDFSAGMGSACGFCQRATVAFCAEQPVVTCEGIGLQHTMIVAKMLLRMFPCRSGEKANHAAGGSDEPAFRSSRTYVQMRPVFVFIQRGH